MSPTQRDPRQTLTLLVLFAVSTFAAWVLEKQFEYLPRHIANIPINAEILLVVCVLLLITPAVYGALTAVQYHRWKGLEKTTGLQGYIEKLEGSPHHPSVCLSKVNRYLDFMGNGASKWTRELELLHQMCTHTLASGGQIRFLILNPVSEACREADQIIGKDQRPKILKSLKILCELEKQFKHFHVRLHDRVPEFRLTFIERRFVSVGHYRYFRKDSKDSPLHLYTDESDWSFFKPFCMYFDNAWDSAVPANWDEVLEPLYEELVLKSKAAH
jgi:hypothetical protein